MNYRTTIERRAAYIRFNNSSTARHPFTALVSNLPGVEVTGYRITTQISFPLSAGPRLVDLARNIAIAKQQRPIAKAQKAPRRPPTTSPSAKSVSDVLHHHPGNDRSR